MSSRLLVLSLLSVLLALVLVATPALAHVRFIVNTGAAGTSGFLTYLKIPHGCTVAGNDTGENPTETIEVSTRQVILKVPAEIGNPLPTPIPLWNLTESTEGTYTVFTWTASSGNELEHWQALVIPLLFDLPRVTTSTRFSFPSLQYCLSGGSANWTSSPPFITVTNATTTTTTTTTSQVSMLEDPDADQNRSISIAAIVIAAVAIAVFVLIWYLNRLSGSSSFTKAPAQSSQTSELASTPFRETSRV